MIYNHGLWIFFYHQELVDALNWIFDLPFRLFQLGVIEIVRTVLSDD